MIEYFLITVKGEPKYVCVDEGVAAGKVNALKLAYNAQQGIKGTFRNVKQVKYMKVLGDEQIRNARSTELVQSVQPVDFEKSGEQDVIDTEFIEIIGD